MAVSAKGQRRLTTQCYVKGEPRNKTDFILKRVKGEKERNSLIVPFKPCQIQRLVKPQPDLILFLAGRPKVNP